MPTDVQDGTLHGLLGLRNGFACKSMNAKSINDYLYLHVIVNIIGIDFVYLCCLSPSIGRCYPRILKFLLHNIHVVYPPLGDRDVTTVPSLVNIQLSITLSCNSVVDPKTLNLDPDPELWPS